MKINETFMRLNFDEFKNIKLEEIMLNLDSD